MVVEDRDVAEVAVVAGRARAGAAPERVERERGRLRPGLAEDADRGVDRLDVVGRADVADRVGEPASAAERPAAGAREREAGEVLRRRRHVRTSRSAGPCLHRPRRRLLGGGKAGLEIPALLRGDVLRLPHVALEVLRRHAGKGDRLYLARRVLRCRCDRGACEHEQAAGHHRRADQPASALSAGKVAPNCLVLRVPCAHRASRGLVLNAVPATSDRVISTEGSRRRTAATARRPLKTRAYRYRGTSEKPIYRPWRRLAPHSRNAGPSTAREPLASSSPRAPPSARQASRGARPGWRQRWSREAQRSCSSAAAVRPPPRPRT